MPRESGSQIMPAMLQLQEFCPIPLAMHYRRLHTAILISLSVLPIIERQCS